MRNNIRLFVFMVFFCLSFSGLNAKEESLFYNPDVTISMDFQDANLKDILKIFSIQSGLNFIASDEVKDKKITLYLDKVPIKETINKLFKANNLVYELDDEANIITVKGTYVPKVATRTKVFYLKYAAVGSSRLSEEISSELGSSSSQGTATGTSSASAGSSSGTVAISIVAAIKNVLTENGKISENNRTNSIVITDVPENFPALEEIITKLDVPIPQVLIDVEMLDVAKDTVDKMGFEFGEKPFTLLLPNAYKHGLRFLGDVALRGADAVSSTTAGGIVFGNVYGQALNFLRTQTDTRYLARPRLMTLDNQTAEISITKDEVVGKKETVNSTTSGTTTSVEYIRSTDLTLTKEGTGVFLRVTPQINLEANEVTMVINPKSSVTATSILASTQADAEVRSTKSIVKVRDGETIVLGGLIHQDKKVIVKKLPVLGDIPILGTLFRHKNMTKDIERELLVFITPHIIKDAGPSGDSYTKKAAFPVREQNAPSLFERQAAINASLNNFDKMK